MEKLAVPPDTAAVPGAVALPAGNPDLAEGRGLLARLPYLRHFT
jgi:hypothetical protein